MISALVVLLVAVVLLYLANLLMQAAGITHPYSTAILVILGLIALLYILSQLGIGIAHAAELDQSISVAQPGGMGSPDAVLIGALVTAMTQIVKWVGLPDSKGPLAVIVLAAVGVGLWLFSQTVPFDRTQTFNIVSAWANVVFISGGIFGLTRALPESFTSFTRPPLGAAQSPTTKM